ncbi:MAG: site-2 protease family protein [Verrucomicrobia bacterium]|nr:site-2 protease family protein [Verrucomicrobiota bacterium]
MKWSWRVGRVADIDLYLHATFLILLAWVALSHYLLRYQLGDAINGLVFICAIFFIVLLHELGHALAARRYGIETRDITLLPIGGVARLERMPDKPLEELIVALAGPAVNVVLAAVFFGILSWSKQIEQLTTVQIVGGPFTAKLLMVNVMMVLFNLIPAFPMDGGRVLRALLALRMDYVRATQIAATFGQAAALLFGFVGLFKNPYFHSPLLVFVAFFVWMGASDEASLVQIRCALAGIPIWRVMMTDFRTLGPREPLAVAVQHTLAGFQQDFPVVEEGRVVGMLTRNDLFGALKRRGETVPVGDVMRREFETADPAEMTDTVFARLQECECRSLPVVQHGQVVGIITSENVGEFLMVQAALRGERPAKIAEELAS